MKKNKSEVLENAEASDPPAPKKRTPWLKISLIVNAVIVAGIAVVFSSMLVINQSNTNPSFCANCHLMQDHVTSYQTSNHLDHLHELAGVQCKDCHDYPLQAEISSGVNYLTGNYDVVSASNPVLVKRTFSDAMCLKCHISQAHVAEETSFLTRNPHDSHVENLKCSSCHVSHGAQIDTCSKCHDNGGQVMVEDLKVSRKNP